MEKNTSFEKQLKRKKKRTLIKAVIAVVVIAVLVVFGYQGYLYLKKLNSQSEDTASVLQYQVQTATKGSITSTMSSSGTLTAMESETLVSQYSGDVELVACASGDIVSQGDALIVVTNENYLSERNDLMEQIDSLSTQMSNTREYKTSLNLTASVAGKIKDVKVEVGSDIESVMDQYGYLCLISTAGSMKTVIEDDSLKLFDTVEVNIDGTIATGTVVAVNDGAATIEIDDDSYLVGQQVSINGVEATLELVNYVRVTATNGIIATVDVLENGSVSRNAKVATLTEYPKEDRYLQMEQQIDELKEQLADLQQSYTITAPYDGKILQCNVSEDDELVQGSELVTIQSLDGYSISLSVDELDIASIERGQSVEITLDAIEGTFEGTVSDISYTASSSGSVVRYTTVVTLDNIEGALAGMSATCKITIADSGEGIIVPVDAVQTVNGEKVVYLAPSGATFGDSYNDTELELSSLTAVKVETGMSDGSYILISGDVDNGELIIVPVLSTTATYSADSTRNNAMGMFGGNTGEMPSFDFSDFASGSSGMPSGGKGGSMPSGDFGGRGDG